MEDKCHTTGVTRPSDFNAREDRPTSRRPAPHTHFLHPLPQPEPPAPPHAAGRPSPRARGKPRGQRRSQAMNIRRKLLLAAATSLAVAGLAVPAARPAFAASLTEVTAFGDNPGGMRMHIYVPDTRPANPAIVVAMHGCGGS